MIIIYELIIKAIRVKPLLWSSRLCTQTKLMLMNEANRLKNCACRLHLHWLIVRAKGLFILRLHYPSIIVVHDCHRWKPTHFFSAEGIYKQIYGHGWCYVNKKNCIEKIKSVWKITILDMSTHPGFNIIIDKTWWYHLIVRCIAYKYIFEYDIIS